MTTQLAPHGDQPVQTAGEPLAQAQAAMIMLHGRGASSDDILSLVPHLNTSGVAYLAPQAADLTWYPYSFLANLDQNEPGLSSALSVIDNLVTQVTDAGIPPERLMLLGFSQGACLALEYAARFPQRYGGIFGLSGGLIGPLETTFTHSGDMGKTPIFLGCSDMDPHIPLARVYESATVFTRLKATVDKRIYPNMAHTIVTDELDAVRTTMTAVVKSV